MAQVTASSVSVIRVIKTSIDVLIVVQTWCQERFQKCSIAITPHKRLPAEILSKIFIHCLPVKTQYYVVEKNEVPWALGKVCSRWRSISRSEPRLWRKVTIDTRYSSKELQAACDHLPSFVYLCVISPPSRNFDTELAPYLWRIQELELEMNPDFLDGFWKSIAGSDCFSAVEVFMIDFEIRGWVGTISEEMITSWAHLAPLKHARSLHDFRLVGGSNFPLFSLHMPWSQLRTVTLACDLTLDQIVQLLQLCSSVETLQLDFPHQSDSDSDDFPFNITPAIPERPQIPLDTPIYSRSLRDLTLSGSIPYHSALFHVISFHQLVYLYIEELDIDGDAQYQLLKQCKDLMHLHIKAASTTAVNIHSGILPLPLLRSLRVIDVENNWLFVALIVPSLVDLVISSRSGSPLDIIAVRDMIILSGCSRFSSLGLLAGDREGQPHLTKLLAAVPTAIDITVRGMAMNADCLQLISVGAILPLLEKLTCEVSTDEEFLWMMDERAHHVAQTPNMSQIYNAHFIVRERVLLDELRLEKIAQLEDTYGMTCDMAP